MSLQTRDLAILISRGEALFGILATVEKPKGVIIFVHGAGSSKQSPRNNYVSKILNEGGFVTLLFDLLTEQEALADEQSKKTRFDIPLLTSRVKIITENLLTLPELQKLPFGYFGASTGAAAALSASTNFPEVVRAIVSRGGRPDLSGSASLNQVKAATLLIVGGNDPETIRLNQKAFQQLKQPRNKRVVIVPNAGHVFEEPGTLEEAAKHTVSWFETFL